MVFSPLIRFGPSDAAQRVRAPSGSPPSHGPTRQWGHLPRVGVVEAGGTWPLRINLFDTAFRNFVSQDSQGAALIGQAPAGTGGKRDSGGKRLITLRRSLEFTKLRSRIDPKEGQCCSGSSRDSSRDSQRCYRQCSEIADVGLGWLDLNPHYGARSLPRSCRDVVHSKAEAMPCVLDTRRRRRRSPLSVKEF